MTEAAPMDHVSAIVVGGGVIGLAIASALARTGRETLLVERNATFGMETSSRSNEVVHASLFHRPGSPQSVLCRKGRDLIHAYCSDQGIGVRTTGKLVLAIADGDVPWLEDVLHRGRANGVDDLAWLEGRDVKTLEPAIRCRAALLSPSSGILDSHGLMLAYLGDLEDAGAAVAFNSEVIAATPYRSGFHVDIRDRASETLTRLACETLINAAGLKASDLAERINGLPRDAIPKVHLAKGTFFKFRGKAPFSRLIVPSQPAWRQGGIFTLDLNGQGKFGPDEEWIGEVDYSLEQARAQGVETAVRNYWPDLPERALAVDYAGIRPRLNGPGEPPADWMFQGPRTHGLPGLINLFGFESPGITASMAIAEVVSAMAEGADSPFPDSSRSLSAGSADALTPGASTPAVR